MESAYMRLTVILPWSVWTQDQKRISVAKGWATLNSGKVCFQLRHNLALGEPPHNLCLVDKHLVTLLDDLGKQLIGPPTCASPPVHHLSTCPCHPNSHSAGIPTFRATAVIFLSFPTNDAFLLKLPCCKSCCHPVQTQLLTSAFSYFLFPTPLWLPVGRPVLASSPPCHPRLISVRRCPFLVIRSIRICNSTYMISYNWSIFCVQSGPVRQAFQRRGKNDFYSLTVVLAITSDRCNRLPRGRQKLTEEYE